MPPPKEVIIDGVAFQSHGKTLVRKSGELGLYNSSNPQSVSSDQLADLIVTTMVRVLRLSISICSRSYRIYLKYASDRSIWVQLVIPATCSKASQRINITSSIHRWFADGS